MWDRPSPGMEPVSPALAGGFLTTAPPGKSLIFHIWSEYFTPIKMMGGRDFPDSPGVKTPCFHCRGVVSIPARGTKTHMQHGQKKKKNDRRQSFPMCIWFLVKILKILYKAHIAKRQ